MRIAVRADASGHIGHGHVMRCLALAKTLRAHGASVCFVCREHEGHLCDLLEHEDMTVHRLPALPHPAASHTVVGEVASLGASWEEDASQTRVAVAGEVDWLIVDHYAIGRPWETLARAWARHVMVIDDLADRAHECDMLLNQNALPNLERRYDRLLPDRCERLTGPAYALLRAEYAELRGKTPPRSGDVRRILVSFGAADACNVTGRALEALVDLDPPNVAVDVVTPSNGAHPETWRGVAGSRSWIRFHHDLPSLASLIAKADLGVGASGTTTWERCCLGLPSLVVTIADNQRSIAEELDAMGIVRWLGDQEHVGVPVLRDALARVLASGIDAAWSERCARLVDGGGSERVRVAMWIAAAAEGDLRLRRATRRDADVLLAWRNDPVVRAASRDTAPVAVEDHLRWLDTSLGDGNRSIYIVERNDVAVGTVRVDVRPHGRELSWTVAESERGRGVGKWMVKVVADALTGPVYADVKKSNDASAAIARHAGLRLEGEDHGFQRFRRDS